MCIGIPMQVERIDGPLVWVAGRGELRRVETALIGPVAVGDWLLVFLGSARERLDAQRAAEVNAALDLLDAAMKGAGAADAAAFELPSSMSHAALALLTGAAAAPAATFAEAAARRPADSAPLNAQVH
ncbi:MAG: HypC/HybG/HupF family hydrogenase formation chaperone [Pseudomonadota bacterium]|jgi:hydrogenase expression/formation protein HypC